MRAVLCAALLFALGCAQATPPEQSPAPAPLDPRTQRALEVYVRFPEPEFGPHVIQRVADTNGIIHLPIPPKDREFLDPEIQELWKIGRAIFLQHPVPDLIRDLRSKKAGDRDFAERRLIELGTLALPELDKATRDSDAAFASRVKAISTSIRFALPPPLDPDSLYMKKQAPDFFKVQFSTSRGDFTVTVHRSWAPQGADRFYNLVRGGFYDNACFFRVIRGFMAQFGIHSEPDVSARWREARIPDDPVIESNKRGRITFATGGPDTRTTQLFINYNDRNARLDAMGFAPFGEVTDGMEIVDGLYAGYGEGAPAGKGPSQGRIQSEGGIYLRAEFPNLDFINRATLVE